MIRCRVFGHRFSGRTRWRTTTGEWSRWHHYCKRCGRDQ